MSAGAVSVSAHSASPTPGSSTRALSEAKPGTSALTSKLCAMSSWFLNRIYSRRVSPGANAGSPS